MIGVAILETDPMVRSILEGHMAKIDGFELAGCADSLKAAKKLYAAGNVQLVLGEVHFQDGEVLDWLIQLRSQKKPVDFNCGNQETLPMLRSGRRCSPV